MAGETQSSLVHDGGEPVQDLYLLNNLIVIMVDHRLGFAELENRYHSTRQAMSRLRSAFESGEMTRINLGLANYFRETKNKPKIDTPPDVPNPPTRRTH